MRIFGLFFVYYAKVAKYEPHNTTIDCFCAADSPAGSCNIHAASETPHCVG